MPTYYVRPDGNDLNVGIAPTNASGTGAFRTVNKALSVVASGETIWIAPGVYRENVTATTTSNLTVAVNIYGDPTATQVAWGAGISAGLVRVTNNLTNDVGTPSGLVLNITRHFHNFRNIRFDGAFYVYQASTTGAITFNECTFTAQGVESTIMRAGNKAPVHFTQCAFFETPINFGNDAQNQPHDIRFYTCFFTTCANGIEGYFSDRSTQNGPNYSVHFINCTIVGGTSAPLYIWSSVSVNGGNGVFRIYNCLITTIPTTTTFRFAGVNANSILENFNAGYSLTRSGVTAGANDITLTTVPYDTLQAKLDNTYNYLPYTPSTGSVLIGAGTPTPPFTSVNFQFSLTTDFVGNAWSQTNPTIGYIESRDLIPSIGIGGYIPLDRSIQTLTVTAGETGKSVHVYLGSTGVTYQTPNLTCYYARNNGTSVNIPLVAGNASTWVSGSLYEVSAVTMPGVYKFDVPNAVIESGATTASIMLRGANAFNGAFVNINIEQPAQSAYLSTLGYKFLSEYAGSDGVLTVNKRTVTTVKCQIADTNGTAVAIGSSTMTVEVYSAANVLLASYTPTVQYAGNGHLTFVLDTQITGTAGTYNAYAIRSASTTDRAVFGPLQIKVNEL